jgi:hypothetical protein
VEAVHRLNDLGAVVTHAARGTSQAGFDAEWRMIYIVTVEGDLISRYEIFDETDLDAALARFEELHPQAPRLENSASQVVERFWSFFANRDWSAMAEAVADDVSTYDHRRVINADVLRGRDAHVANMRAVAEVGFEGIASTVIATRGQRLALIRIQSSAHGFESGETSNEILGVVGIDADNRLTASALFDPDDVDAAFEELDAHYLAGEAAPCSRTWSVIAQALIAFNQHEVSATAPDSVAIEHRPLLSTEAVDLAAAISAVWDLTPDASMRIEAVHRLSEHGAVVTFVLNGASQNGFHAEWRMIDLLTVEGDLIGDCEVFDEADLDAALTRFEELHPQAPLLQNAATRIWARLTDAYNRRDMDDYLSLSTADIRFEDRRQGLRDEFEGPAAQRKAVVALFEASPSSVQMTAEPIAIRGSRLALTHVCYRDTEYADRPIVVEMVQIVEAGNSGLLDRSVSFDPDDIDAAFAELDARYLAGEAAPYARTWSAMARTCAVFNQGELPATTPDSVFVDHRPGLTVDAVDLPSYLRVMWDVTPDIRVEIEAVHRLSELGAVPTHAVNETSPEGFNAEWRGILIYTLEADMVNRCEVFDEADLDAALARFDELDGSAP